MTTGNSRPLLPPILVSGFVASIGLWVLWFVTHLPWLHQSESINIPILLGYWGLAFVVAGFNVGPGRAWKVGVGAGLVSALVGLLALGTKLRAEVQGGGPADPTLHPSTALIVLGFLATGTLLGAAGMALGGALAPKSRATQPEPDWLSRFAWVTCIAAAPLLFVGGLVTSTDSGMAVPDWPNTFGSNMFLYPLGPRSAPNVYLEHSHRLFGTLVGLTSIVLTCWVWLSNQRFYVRVYAIVVLTLIIAQGLLGAMRVIQNDRISALVHGVIAQVIFAGLIALAIYLSPSFRGLSAILPPPPARRIKLFATAAMHTMLVQLVFGAMYRHLRSSHVLWSHAGFSVVVVVAAILAGFSAHAFMKDAANLPAAAKTLRRGGTWLIVAVGFQFLLGWFVFMTTAGQNRRPESVPQAVIRTTHQANGALLLGLTTVVFVMARQANRLAKRATKPAG
ncbi:hypothetical protein PHYC_02711 [Phycisphaerales bacterium]|nr:hypothetical protein PHYC_02711 [Phycisphaerales bacterium]